VFIARLPDSHSETVFVTLLQNSPSASANVIRASSRLIGPGMTRRPRCGSRIEFHMSRYKNPPSLAPPWDRGWFGKN